MASAYGAWLAIGSALSLGLAVGCGPSPFVCQSDAACVGGAGQGICQESGYCSFPDDACPSGQRYGELSGDLSGECTVPDDGTTSSTATTTSASGSASGSAGATGTPSSTSGASADDSEASTAAISDASSSAAVSETAEASSSGPDATAGGSTGSPTADPYGPCADGCTLPGATCLTTNQDENVCASPCEDPTMPAVSCPAPLQEGYAVGCVSTQMGGGDYCALLCADGMCPAPMVCREVVCVFEP